MISELSTTTADEPLAAADAPPDRDLLRAFIESRSEPAFETLVRRYGSMVFGVCRRLLGNEHDAADAFQAVFIVLARKAAGIDNPEVLGAWLYNVAYRTSLKARGAAYKRKTREQQVTVMPELAVECEVAPADDVLAVLDEELRCLPAKYQAPVILCDLQGFSRKEVASKLSLAEGTLSSRLATGRQKLADRLRRRGVTIGATALGVVLAQQAAYAQVPAALIASTAQAAGPAAAGHAVGGLVTSKAWTLSNGMLHSMLFAKLQIILLTIVLPCLLAVAVQVVAVQNQPEDDEASAIATLQKHGAKFRWQQMPAGKKAVMIDLKRTAVQDQHMQLMRFFPELRELNLTETAVGDAGCEHLVKLPKLQILRLASTGVSEASLKHIAKLAKLRALSLDRTKVQGSALAELAVLTELHDLELRRTAVGDAELKLLAPLKHLHTLELMETRITDLGLKELTVLPELAALRVEATGVTDAGLVHLKDCPKLISLSLQNVKGVTDTGIAHLTHLPNLDSLNLQGTHVTDACFAELAKLWKLAWLDLDFTGVTGKGVGQLAGHKLGTLWMSNTKVTDVALREIAIITTLQDLHLDDNPAVTHEGIKELTTLRRLGALALAQTKATDESLQELTVCKEINLLNISGTKVTDAGMKILATYPKLRWLAIHNTGVTDAGFHELSKVSDLDTLWMSWCKVSETGLKDLGQLKNLGTLRLGGLPMTDSGLKDLAGLKRLHTLWLDWTKVTDAGMKELISLERLQELRLDGTAVTDAGLRELANLKNLKTVDAPKTKVTDAGAQELRSKLGQVAVNNRAANREMGQRDPVRVFWWLAALFVAAGMLGLLGWRVLKRKSVVPALAAGSFALLAIVGYRAIQVATAQPAATEPVQVESKVRILHGHMSPVHIVRFTPDAKRLVSASGWPGSDTTIRIWDLATDQEIYKIRALGQVGAMELTPDGKHAFVGAFGGNLWIDVENGALLKVLRGQKNSVPSVYLAGDGVHAYSASFDGTVRRWNLQEGVEAGQVKVAGDKARGVAELPDGRILTATADGVLQIWDFATKTELKRIETKIQWLSYMRLTPDKKQALLGTWDVSVWDLESGARTRFIRPNPVHRDIPEIAFSPDDKTMLTVGFDGSARMWDWETGKFQQMLGSQEEWLFTANYSRDGKLIATAGGGANDGDRYVNGTEHDIRIWEMTPPEPAPVVAEETSDRGLWLWLTGGAGLLALGSLAGLVALQRRRRPALSSMPTNQNDTRVTFTCASCGRRLKAKPELVGKKIACPGCGAPTRVEAPA